VGGLNFYVKLIIDSLSKGVKDGDGKKVIVAQEQRILRDGLISLLKDMDIETVGEAEDGIKALQLVERLRPDLVLMGLSFPGMGGVSATREIKKRFPETKILVLSSLDSEEHIRTAFKAGADGYCLEDSSVQELVSAIGAVLAGKVYFGSSISDRILNGYLRSHRPSKLDRLTGREKEILKLLGGGCRNEEIARLLSISDKTVAKHKSNIMRKLDCHTVSDLAAFAPHNRFSGRR
jgi:two-component system response regulator NreC